jgi:hypothetical protein
VSYSSATDSKEPTSPMMADSSTLPAGRQRQSTADSMPAEPTPRSNAPVFLASPRWCHTRARSWVGGQ